MSTYSSKNSILQTSEEEEEWQQYDSVCQLHFLQDEA